MNLYDSDKIARMRELAEDLSSHGERSVRNTSEIIINLLNHIDDLQEDYQYLKEQLAYVKEDRQDELYLERIGAEQEQRRTPTRTRRTRRVLPNAANQEILYDFETVRL